MPLTEAEKKELLRLLQLRERGRRAARTEAPSRLREIGLIGRRTGTALLEQLPEIAGSIALEQAFRGAMTGLRVPGGPLVKGGAATLGAVLGGVGGLLAKRRFQGRPATPEEIGMEAATAGLSVPTAGIARFLAAPKRQFFRPLAKKVIRGAPKIARELRRFGSSLTPAQASESAILDIMQNVADASLTTAGAAATVRQGQAAAAQTIAEETAARFLSRASSREVKDAFINGIVRGKETARRAVSTLYRKLDFLVGEAKIVNLTPVVDLVEGSPELKRELVRVLRENGLKLPPKGRIFAVNFTDAQMVRSDLLAAMRAKQQIPGFVLPGKTSRRLGLIEDAVDQQMEQAAAIRGQGVVDLWRRANEMRKGFAQTFENTFIKRLVRDSPDEIGEVIARIKSADQIDLIKRAVDPDTFNLVQSAYIEHLMGVKGAARVATRVRELGGIEVEGKALKQILAKTPQSVREAVLGKDVAARLDEVADILFAVQQRQSQQAGTVAVRLAQFGAVVGAGGAAVSALAGRLDLAVAAVGSSGLILLGPKLIHRLLQSRAGQEVLIDGLTTEPTRAQAARWLTRVLVMAGPKAIGLQEFDRPVEQIAGKIAARAFSRPILEPSPALAR